jgi:imidazolonepropionase-like amidohydrolase
MAAAGPLLSTLDHWLNLPAERQFIHLTSDSTARAGVRYIKSLGSDAVKVWFIVNSGQTFENMEQAVMSAGDEARKVGLPLIVHATGIKEAKAALRAGAKLLVHSVDDAPLDSEFLELMKRNSTVYCPTLTVRSGYYRMFDAARTGRPPVVDDPLHAIDSLTLVHVMSSASVGAAKVAARKPPDPVAVEKTRQTMNANLLAVRKAGIPIATGTDAGNPLTLHGPSIYAEMEAMQAAGLTAMDVLVASTRNGARAMGRERDFGTIEKGKLADLVVVGADPARDIKAMRRPRFVVRGGVVRSPSGPPFARLTNQ